MPGVVVVLFNWDRGDTRGQWVVLLEQVHHTLAEVRHVLAHHKSKMAGGDLFVVNDVVTDAITGPARVGQVGERVLSASEHSHGHLSDVLEFEERGVTLLVASEWVLVVVGPLLEAVFLQVLGVVKDRLDGGAVGLVTHVHSKARVVIKLGVLRNEKLGEELAESGDVGAEERCDT